MVKKKEDWIGCVRESFLILTAQFYIGSTRAFREVHVFKVEYPRTSVQLGTLKTSTDLCASLDAVVCLALHKNFVAEVGTNFSRVTLNCIGYETVCSLFIIPFLFH